jgi:hypothetical protein
METAGADPVATKKFLMFLKEQHHDLGRTGEYMAYLTKGQGAALDELVSAGVISPEAAWGAGLSPDDLVPWEFP